MSAQNIYDDPDFFAGYAELRRTESGLNAVLEWPAFKALLPPSLDGLRVLDLGCGMGQFSRAARQMGAREVIGVDVSECMLAEARARTQDDAIHYVRADLETYEPESDGFDLVASSLAIHYVPDYRGLARRIAAALKPGGRFVFSVEHPVMTCAPALTWQLGPDGTKLFWPIDAYRDEGLRTASWFVDGVRKYHRTVETYVNGLVDAGLKLVRLTEPEAPPEFLQARPDLVDQRRRPPFLMLAAERER